MWSVKNARTQPNLSDNPISDVIIHAYVTVQAAPISHPVYEREKKTSTFCRVTKQCARKCGWRDTRWSRVRLKLFLSTVDKLSRVNLRLAVRIVHGHNAYLLQILVSKDSGTGFSCNSIKFETSRGTLRHFKEIDCLFSIRFNCILPLKLLLLLKTNQF